MTTPSVDEQVRALMFGSEFGDASLEATMREGLRRRLLDAEKEHRPLRVYCGYDPSRPDLHLGHSITLRKLRQFQDFGHDVIFVIGTFTAQVGDTSDRTSARPRLTLEQVLESARTYAEQAFKILDRTKTTVAYNHEWLSPMTMADVISLASNFTVQQFLVRDNYRKRLDAQSPIGLHEFLYALLQGYDMVHLRADVQIGATEQLFNILAGRKLQEVFGQPPGLCITYPVLVGTDGTMRMSKSAGNYVGLSEPPDEQFGKVMGISDETMLEWIKYVTRWPVQRIEDETRSVKDGTRHPMDLKKALAWEVVSAYHGDAAADAAQQRFETIHQRREEPEDVPEVAVGRGASIIDVLSSVKGVTSRSEARRLIAGKGVKFRGATITDPDFAVTDEGMLQVGKRRFLRLRIV